MKPYQIFSLLVVLIPTFVGRGYCQSSEAIGSSEPCVIVDVQIKGGNLTFVVDSKHLQDTPLLEYLGKHRREHPDNTCASIFVLREVTLGDIGKIQATVSKAQYSPIHVYCCSIGAYQVNEIIFSAPMPVESAKDGRSGVLQNGGSNPKD